MPKKGIKLSEEYKRKLNRKGYKCSEETKWKISKSLKYISSLKKEREKIEIKNIKRLWENSIYNYDRFNKS